MTCRTKAAAAATTACLALASPAFADKDQAAAAPSHTLADELDAKASASSGKTPPAVAKTMEDATKALRDSKIAEKAVKQGDLLPAFALPDAAGKTVNAKDLLAKGPLVVTFYRGGWCPYCNIQLRALQKVLPDFQKRGATLVAITPAKPDDTLSTSQKHDLAFPVLTDAGNAYAKSLGLVFHLPDDLRKVYQGFGIDLEKNQGNDAWELPLPATYVVDRSGRVIWSFIDVDYKKRAEPAAILKALDSIGAH